MKLLFIIAALKQVVTYLVLWLRIRIVNDSSITTLTEGLM